MTAYSILYDPDCGFCRVCVAVVLRWDRHGRLRPVSLTSTDGIGLLPGMPEDERMASWHLVLPNGTIHSAGAAFSPLFRLLPGGGPPARLTDRFPRAAEVAYRFVAEHRTAFGKPLPAAAKRWADRVISESARNSR
jgi:predicted DCC family thiol-disulfide oxidoreductase YuxK